MPLTREQAEQIWTLYKDSALWKHWPEYRAELGQRLQARHYHVGDRIWIPEDMPRGLLLIGQGVIRQTMDHNGLSWFSRELRAGGILGQHRLLGHGQEASADTVGGAVLFEMPVDDVRLALERNPDLTEALLLDSWAADLRAVPLFAPLSDAQIRWLAQIVDRRTLAAGETLSLNAPSGAWVIQSGQIAVEGPASQGHHDWSLSAGNFFLSSGAFLGAPSAVSRASAKIPSNVYVLGVEHLQRLYAAFPGVAQKIEAPLDIVTLLTEVNPWPAGALGQDQFLHLAQYVSWRFVPDGHNISQQGENGQTFVVLVRGNALISAVDDQARLRPTNQVSSPYAYGWHSLLQEGRREVTVRAAGSAEGPVLGRGTEVISLHRQDLQRAFEDKPALWQAGVPLFDQFVPSKSGRSGMDWLENNEELQWFGRAHWLWLMYPLLVLAGALLLALLLLEAWYGPGAPLVTSMLVLIGLVATPLGLFLVLNYLDDYYALTDRRITRRDRRLLAFEARSEAPLDMVQDVTVQTSLIGQLLGFGDLDVRTAAKVGVITFAHVPDPYGVRNRILRHKAGAVAASIGQQREALRRQMMNRMDATIEVPDIDHVRALGHLSSQGQKPRWSALRPLLGRGRPSVQGDQAFGSSMPGVLGPVAERLRTRLQHVLHGTGSSATRTGPGSLIWHKHWLSLLGRTWKPLTLLAALVVLATGTRRLDLAASALQGSGLVLALGLAGAAGWLWWNAIDYWNDIYVVTDDKIMDIERLPLGFNAKERQGGLEKVQTVYSKQNGFWATLFNYGDVVIHTAAADEGFTFEFVGAPRTVQAQIFRKLDAFRRRQEEARVRAGQRQLVEALQVYDQLRHERRP